MNFAEKIKSITAEIQDFYQKDDVPWVLGYSDGKEATPSSRARECLDLMSAKTKIAFDTAVFSTIFLDICTNLL